MPARSKAQYNYMQMMAHNPKKKKSKGAGPSPEVAKEFIEKTSKEKRKQFARKR